MPSVFATVSRPTRAATSARGATRCRSSGNVDPIHSVGSARIASAASARTASLPAHPSTNLPANVNSLGSSAQNGSVIASPTPAKASPRASAEAPCLAANAGARAAPIDRQTRKTASMRPNAYALLPMRSESRCVSTTSTANTRNPEANASPSRPRSSSTPPSAPRSLTPLASPSLSLSRSFSLPSPSPPLRRTPATHAITPIVTFAAAAPIIVPRIPKVGSTA